QALAEAPADLPNKPAFDAAVALARRGLWRRAENEFAKLLDPAAPPPAVLHNLAAACGWQACEAELAQGLHHFAKLDVPLEEAVEAEALAQLVDPKIEEAKVESVRLSYPVRDEDAVAERLASDRRTESYELDPESLEEDEVTRPRSTHILLDRPAPSSGAELTVDDAPHVVAFISVYGKRTDRAAQVEVTTDRGARFGDVERLIGEVLGDAIGPQAGCEVVTEKSAPDEALSWRWRLPDDTPAAKRRELLAERRRRALLHDWPLAPRAALGGLSPRDAAAKPELRIALLASVLIIEQAATNASERPLFDELRQSLGLPPAETIDPATVDWDRLPLVRLARLDVAQLDDQRLVQAFNRAAMSGATVATLRAAEEMVRRDGAIEGVDAAYRQLIRAEPDPDRALAWAAQAKERAERDGKPGGEWALLRLEIQIERGDPAGVQAALDDVRQHHLGEPGIPEATYELLYTAGLIAPRSPSTGAAPIPGMTPAAPAEGGQRIWTPGQDAAPAAAGKAPAIWTP
ncbi:MAG TPA: hypothetical protein PJ982_14470, partial [Lacipirellulaceae bacterium]|nr:hypothetical protein [Lacipirellulaceae bacterium]